MKRYVIEFDQLDQMWNVWSDNAMMYGSYDIEDCLDFIKGEEL